MEESTPDGISTIRQRLEQYLSDKDFGFNPDAALVKAVLSAMVKRKEQFGEDYCPCRRVSGDKEKDALIICPCVYHIEEIEQDGFCHCRLFSRS